MFVQIHYYARRLRTVRRTGGVGRGTPPARAAFEPTHSACAGTALRNSAAAAAVQDLGRHGRAPHRRVMKILLIASGGERSKLGVAPQNHACWWLSAVKKPMTTNRILASNGVCRTHVCVHCLIQGSEGTLNYKNQWKSKIIQL